MYLWGMLENLSVQWALCQKSVGGLTLWWLFQRWIIKLFWQEVINILFQFRIFGGPDIYVREGSSLQLECVISQTIVSPKFVVWDYNGELVHGSSFIKVQDSPSTSSSTLNVVQITRYQAGNCLCHPDNLNPPCYNQRRRTFTHYWRFYKNICSVPRESSSLFHSCLLAVQFSKLIMDPAQTLSELKDTKLNRKYFMW